MYGKQDRNRQNEIIVNLHPRPSLYSSNKCKWWCGRQAQRCPRASGNECPSPDSTPPWSANRQRRYIGWKCTDSSSNRDKSHLCSAPNFRLLELTVEIAHDQVNFVEHWYQIWTWSVIFCYSSNVIRSSLIRNCRRPVLATFDSCRTDFALLSMLHLQYPLVQNPSRKHTP